MPERVQLSRRKGWKMPPNTIKVDRTTKWGNPCIVGVHGTRAECVRWLELALAGHIVLGHKRDADGDLADKLIAYAKMVRRDRRFLVGKNLACWCPNRGALPRGPAARRGAHLRAPASPKEEPMTTKLRKPVFRETQAAVRDRGAKFRPLVVGIIPGDVIVLRLKGTRYGCEIAISSVWHEAMSRKAIAEAQAKRDARKGMAR